MRHRWFAVAALVAAILFSAGGAAADRSAFGDELSTDHYARSRSIDVQHYKLDVAFDPKRKEVWGTVSVSLSPLSDGLTVVDLDAGPMRIEEVTLSGVEESTKLGFRHDEENLRIELPRGYDRGESLNVNVRYAAHPGVGLYFVGPDEAYPDRPSQVWSQGEAEDNHHWFPSFDFPSDRATSEQIYTVPAEWTAVGNGELVEVTEDSAAGTRSFHYRMDVPHVSYLTSVVAGRFEEYAEEWDGIPIQYFVPEGTGRETAMRSFDRTPDMLRFFSEKTGVRYPYAKYAQTCVVDFIYGGMENISATTQTAETLHDERAALEFDSWGLVAHEAAHQWFGDLLTCADWSQAWLNEGFATYWENLWREHAQGRDEFLYRMLEDRESYLAEDRDDYRSAIVTRRYTDPMDIFDSHLYPKGAWVLHMLRGVLGDEKFFQAMAHYTETYRGQVVETDQLRRAIAASTGVNLERFFDQWIYHGGHPELEIDREWDAKQGVLTLQVKQVQDVDGLTPLFAMPLEIAVDTAGGTVGHTLRLEHLRQDVTLRLDTEPLLVRIDPGFRLLAEIELERSTAEMLRGLSEDPNPVGRIFAARDLARRAPGDVAISGLAGALAGDPFYGVRIEVAKALGAIRGAAARDALIAGLDDDDARVRTAIANALGEFREDDEAATALKRLLSSDQGYGTYGAAVLSLAKIGAPQARSVAMKALGNDSFREIIRVKALEAIGELGEMRAEEALDALERSAYVEGDARLRRGARKAAREIRKGKAGKSVDELSAELERLKQDLRYQSSRIEDLEKQ